MRISDWSSDVCSSDLHARPALAAPVERGHVPPPRAPVDQAFQIFLEIIRPPSSEQDRAPAAGLWAQPQRAYPAAVRRGPETGFGVIRQAAAGGCIAFHPAWLLFRKACRLVCLSHGRDASEQLLRDSLPLAVFLC